MNSATGNRVGLVLAARSGRDSAAPGMKLDVNPDLILLDGPGAAAVLAALPRGSGEEKLPKPVARRLAFVPGAPQPPEQLASVARFARTHGLALDMESSRAGFPATVAVESGRVDRDDVVLATRADVGALGGLGCAVVRMSISELADVLQGRPARLTAPEGTIVRLDGRPRRWVGAFDLAVAVRDALGSGDRRVLELGGEAVAGLDIPDRMALCAALAALGWASVIPPDTKTEIWLRARRVRRGVRRALPPAAEAGTDLALDASHVAASVVRDRSADRQIEPDPLPVQEVFLAGDGDDLALCSGLLRDRNIKAGTYMAWIPSSRKSLLHAIESGVAADLVRAGAAIHPPGSWPPPPATGVRRLATGDCVPGALLSGAAVAASTAVAGYLVDADTMQRKVRRATRRAP